MADKVKNSERGGFEFHEDVLEARANQAANQPFTAAGVKAPELGEDPAFNEIYRAARALRSGLKELYDRLDTVDADRTRTGEEKKRLKGQIRDKHAGQPAKAVDSACKRAEATISGIDARLNAALRDGMSVAEGREVRDFVRSQSSPVNFLFDSIKKGDRETLSAVLAHRPYLSGIDAEQQQQIKAAYLAANFAEDTARRARLAAAVERLDANANNYLVEQARMVDSHEAKRLEAERQATDDAVTKPLSDPSDTPAPANQPTKAALDEPFKP